MLGAVHHVKSNTIADFTGTVTVFNSAGNTTTANATDIVRPSDWNSTHLFNASISGNTSGSSNVQGATNIVLAGGSNVTLSMVTGASVATVTISAAGGTLSRYTDWGADVGVTSTSVVSVARMSVRRFIVQEPITFTRVDIPVSFSFSTSATTNTYAMVISSAMVLYTSNASTLSPIVGVSGTNTVTAASNTGAFSSVSGGRLASFGLATMLTPSEYYVGFQFSTATSSIGASTTSINMTLAPVFNSNAAYLDFNTAGASSTNFFFAGLWSTNISNTTQTIGISTINQSGSNNAVANIPLMFRNW